MFVYFPLLHESTVIITCFLSRTHQFSWPRLAITLHRLVIRPFYHVHLLRVVGRSEHEAQMCTHNICICMVVTSNVLSKYEPCKQDPLEIPRHK